MAEAAVGYVLEKLGDALLKKAPELQAVSGRIKQMQLQLGFLKAFLRDADSKCNRDESVKAWVNEIRHIAHRIEDVIDTFLVEIEEKRQKGVHWYSKIPMRLKKTDKINKLKLSSELEEITQVLKTIYEIRIGLGIKDIGAGSEENGQNQLSFRPRKPFDFDDSEVVGLEDDKHKIMNQLLDRSISRRMVLSIVGTGGLGKTTLAQKIYKSVEIKTQFDCCTWLSISQKFILNDLWREIIYSIKPRMRQQNPPVKDEDLPMMLKSSLRHKRYLIILDDVWMSELWDRLKMALPDSNNASRVIITSRFSDVGKEEYYNTLQYKLQYLTKDESLALLFRKAFQQHIRPENYPPDLLDIAQILTRKCYGLPLALVVLGGILSRRERTYSAWMMVLRTMDWHDDGRSCNSILAMSYEDLSCHLKPCFLYFAAFPENYKISVKHVTKMWLAEGFIPKDGSGTMEDTAEDYLQELVQRCLIQVTERSWNGNHKYCNIHDLLQDLAINKAKEENFFTIFSKEYYVNQLTARKPRRAALQFFGPTENGAYSENTRSLLCFGLGPSSSNDCGFRLLNYSGLRLLRVLTLESVDMTTFTPRHWPKGFIHLRYLGIRYCTFGEEIFKNISFYNLETIDLTGSRIHFSYHPNETTYKSQGVIGPTLRHVYGDMNVERILPLKWDHLTDLQTLKSVGHREVPRLEGCVNLRTLGICYQDISGNERVFSPLEEWQTLKGVLKSMEKLLYLRITTSTLLLLPFQTGGTRDLPCHKTIEYLCLTGIWGSHICVPSVEMFPTYLTKLTLQFSRLHVDPMPIFERLHSLRILRLGPLSYIGTDLICSTGGFPNLQKLKLEELPRLCHWDIKEGAMPILRQLIIDCCPKLHTLPDLQNVWTLQELLVKFPSRELQQSMQSDEVYKIKHIPYVCLTREDISSEREHRMEGEDLGKKVHTPSVSLTSDDLSREQKHLMQGDQYKTKLPSMHPTMDDLSHERQHHMQGEDPEQKVRILEELLVNGPPSRDLHQPMQGEDPWKKVRILEELLLVNGPSHELQQPMQEEYLGQEVRILEDLLLVDSASRATETHARRRSREKCADS